MLIIFLAGIYFSGNPGNPVHEWITTTRGTAPLVPRVVAQELVEGLLSDYFTVSVPTIPCSM
jgi:hypothetical protein